MNSWLTRSLPVPSLVFAAFTAITASAVFGLGSSGCSSSTPAVTPAADSGAGDGGGEPADGGADGSTDAGIDNTTWTGIYAAYFGPGSRGQCGNAGCHNAVKAGVVCSTKADCYASLVSNHEIGTDAAVQPLVDPVISPLIWVSRNGGMPANQPRELDPKVTADLKVWVAAGALNN